MSRRLEAVAVGCAAFALGALIPWLPLTSPPSESAPSTIEDSPALLARASPMPTAPPRDEAIIAIGDKALHDATECLNQRGVVVHPRIIRSVDELHKVMATATSRYSVVHVHVASLERLVDGNIEYALALAPPGTRVIWATIRYEDDPWGGFSPEERINASIRNVVASDPHGRLLDWRSATSRHPDWYVDGAGLTSQGCAEYAARVVKLSGLARGT